MPKTTNPVKSAHTLLHKHHVESPPVDVAAIARSTGLQISYADLPDDISGVLDLTDEPRAFINKSHHKNRQRFTLAHELGHFVLHRNAGIHVDKGFFRDARSSEGVYYLEIEANRFAAELLMPEDLLRKAIACFGDVLQSDDAVLQLSQKFQVSATAVSLRFQALGLSF